MNVLIIGSGGREHALAWKIKSSPILKNLFVLPGNPGTAALGQNIDIKADDYEQIIHFCATNNIDLVVIGPEQPLVDGLADLLRDADINVFGPSKSAARIEGDKAYAKNLMRQYGIPTAEYKIFQKENHKDAIKYLENISYPVVIKASGLAGGKGVIICNEFTEAINTIDDFFFNKRFGSAGESIVIEEFLTGEEASIFAVTDGKNYVILPTSQDHKRIFDNDKGLNTGGMGAYAPATIIDKILIHDIENYIVLPILNALKEDNSEFNGCLYCGLMITERGPKVIEFNCRFGDPETQAVLPLLGGDFLTLLYSAAVGKIDRSAIEIKGGCAVCIVAVSDGYPENYKKGFIIEGIDRKDDDVMIFHAGIKFENGKYYTDGGRVFGITAFNEKYTIKDCIEKAYDNISKISFEGIHYRKDIGRKALKS